MFCLFNYIKKTAGTSVRGELSKLFQVREDNHKDISREEVTVTRSDVTVRIRPFFEFSDFEIRGAVKA
tara:strand:- start:565 stop:768 length:204 start_codon:yes stop_codon:yes gene_type:complete